MLMKRFILRLRLFFSRFQRRKYYQEKGFIYEKDDE